MGAYYPPRRPGLLLPDLVEERVLRLESEDGQVEPVIRIIPPELLQFLHRVVRRSLGDLVADALREEVELLRHPGVENNGQAEGLESGQPLVAADDRLGDDEFRPRADLPLHL